MANTLSADQVLALGREVLADEARALSDVQSQLNGDFSAACQVIAGCKGRFVVTGMGKANFVGQKISATFASTGTPSHFVHPADALHGDLGRITEDDVVLALSHSGETDEMLELVGPIRNMGATVLAMTASKGSSLGRASDLTLEMGRWDEAGMGLAPTTSTTVMMALGDALAMVVLRLRGFTVEDFAQFHPGGALGRRLKPIHAVMRTGDMLPVVNDRAMLSKVIATMTATPGRPGAAIVVDQAGKLAGIFTDGDLRRLSESGSIQLDTPVRDSMGTHVKTVSPSQHVSAAADVLRSNHVDQVVVVDDDNRPVGLLDVQDLLTLRIM